jgi:predicted transcriptional regulator
MPYSNARNYAQSARNSSDRDAIDKLARAIDELARTVRRDIEELHAEIARLKR